MFLENPAQYVNSKVIFAYEWVLLASQRLAGESDGRILISSLKFLRLYYVRLAQFYDCRVVNSINKNRQIPRPFHLSLWVRRLGWQDKKGFHSKGRWCSV